METIQVVLGTELLKATDRAAKQYEVNRSATRNARKTSEFGRTLRRGRDPERFPPPDKQRRCVLGVLAAWRETIESRQTQERHRQRDRRRRHPRNRITGIGLAWISHRVCSGSRGAAQTRSLQRRGPKTTYTPVTCIMPGCWRTSRAAPEHAGRTGFMARRPCCAWPTGLTKYFN